MIFSRFHPTGAKRKLSRILTRPMAGILMAVGCVGLGLQAGAASSQTPPATGFAPAPGLPGAVVPPPPGAMQIVENTNALAWTTRSLQYQAKSGETEAKFKFGLTNVSKEVVTIAGVHTSCGCTVAQLPSQPWVLQPGDRGDIGVTVDLRGKMGNLVKTVTVTSSVGIIPLMVQVSIPRVDPNSPLTAMDRDRNLKVAAVDRQAVFRGDCANCHVTPTIGKTGKALYVAACGICHDGEHRASMVPNLRALNKPTDAAYWTQWVSEGRVGSLMPAFSSRNGGILSTHQVKTLVEYLSGDFQNETSIPGVSAPTLAPAPAVPVNRAAELK